MRQGKAEQHTLNLARQNRAMYIKTHISFSLPPQCHSEAVVCDSTSKMYLRSEFLGFLYQHL